MSAPRPARAQEAIATHSLTHRYPGKGGGVLAVDHLDLAVPRGLIYGFLGPNGAGKSTTIRMLTASLPPTEGTAAVAGHDVGREPLEVKRRVGVVPETPGLYERLTGAEQVELAARLYGLRGAEIARRRGQLLELLDLGGDTDRMVIDYSTGMRKKLALACALIHAPEVLFLDEAFSGVDPLATSAIKRLLRAMVDERGATVFFSTHVMELAQAFCDRVGIIHKGRLVAEGSIAELRARAGLLGEATLEEVFTALVGGPGLADVDLLAWLRDPADPQAED